MASRKDSKLESSKIRLQSTQPLPSKSDEPHFIAYDDSFRSILGDSPSIETIETRETKFAHEAGVYIPTTRTQYFTSNWQTGESVDIYGIDVDSRKIRQLNVKSVINANGACNWRDGVLFCSQGDLITPSALVYYDPHTEKSEIILDVWQDRQFNSINDVVVHPITGDIWFTDPTYGYEQAFRPSPQLPSQVYRFDVEKGRLWAVADGFSQCNGLCFSPDLKTMYITDTGAIQAHGKPADGHNMHLNPRLPSAIYEYDVVGGGKRLSGRRLFASCTEGVPDGIKCDKIGNVYSGCGDGVHVWDPEGTLIGKIFVGSVVGNLNFAPQGLWIMAEERLILAKIGVKGALESD